jgi:hypothetical protein
MQQTIQGIFEVLPPASFKFFSHKTLAEKAMFLGSLHPTQKSPVCTTTDRAFDASGRSAARLVG